MNNVPMTCHNAVSLPAYAGFLPQNITDYFPQQQINSSQIKGDDHHQYYNHRRSANSLFFGRPNNLAEFIFHFGGKFFNPTRPEYRSLLRIIASYFFTFGQSVFLACHNDRLFLHRLIFLTHEGGMEVSVQTPGPDYPNNYFALSHQKKGEAITISRLWQARRDSNPQPSDLESDALPLELLA